MRTSATSQMLDLPVVSQRVVQDILDTTLPVRVRLGVSQRSDIGIPHEILRVAVVIHWPVRRAGMSSSEVVRIQIVDEARP